MRVPEVAPFVSKSSVRVIPALVPTLGTPGLDVVKLNRARQVRVLTRTGVDETIRAHTLESFENRFYTLCMQGWELLEGEAQSLGCWVRALGEDSHGRFHAVAGPSSILRDSPQTQNDSAHPPRTCHQLSLQACLELQLPLGAGNDQLEAGVQALRELISELPKIDEATGEVTNIKF
jgi:hypothetical protein